MTSEQNTSDAHTLPREQYDVYPLFPSLDTLPPERRAEAEKILQEAEDYLLALARERQGEATKQQQKHYPGGHDHNQMSHGRGHVPVFGSSEEAEAWAKKKYPTIAFDFQYCHPVYAREVLQTLDRLTRDYPQVTASIDYIGTGVKDIQGMQELAERVFSEPKPGKMIYMFANSPGKGHRHIVMNPAIVSDPVLVEKLHTLSEEKGYHPPDCSTVGGTFAHEYGHIVQDYFTEEGREANFAHGEILPPGLGNVAQTWPIWAESWAEDAGRGVSGYARDAAKQGSITFQNESWAEGFTSRYHTPKSKWSAYTKALDTFLKEVGHPFNWEQGPGTRFDELYERGTPEYDAARRRLWKLSEKLGIDWLYTRWEGDAGTKGIIKHHPGGHDHDQQSHNPHHTSEGTGGSGESSVPHFSAPHEAEAWARNRFPHVRVWDFYGVDPQLARRTLAQLDKLEKDWPGTMDRVEYVGSGTIRELHPMLSDWAGIQFGTEPSPIAGAGVDRESGERHLLLNPKYFSGAREMAEAENDPESIAYHPPGTNTLEGAITHEFGHLAEYFLSDEGANLNFMDGDILPPGLGNVAKTVELWKQNWHRAGRYVSQYAKDSYDEDELDKGPGEAWAEGFSSHYFTPVHQRLKYTQEMDKLFAVLGHPSQWTRHAGAAIHERYHDAPEQLREAKTRMLNIARRLGMEDEFWQWLEQENQV